MASEMLKAVLEAEKKCSQKEADARKEAELDKQNARAQAKTLIADTQRESEKMLKKRELEMTQMTEMELERARADVQIECGRLSKNARKNIGSVTKHVVEMLTSV